jgi:O-antigen/teichoic acid export membrane protein
MLRLKKKEKILRVISPVYTRLFYGAGWSFVGMAATRMFSMITTVFIARFLGRDQYGVYGMVDSTVGMFGLFAGFALGSTLTKYLAEFRSKDPARAGRILSLISSLSFLTATAVAVAVAIYSPWLARETLNRPEIAPLLRIGSLLLFFSTLYGIQSGILSGFEAFRKIARISLVQAIVSPTLAIPLVYYYGLQGAIISSAVVAAIGLIVASMAVQTECKKYGIQWNYFNLSSFMEIRIIWTYALPTVLSGLLVIPVIWLTNTMLISQPNGYAELGIFNAANQWRNFIIFIPQVLGSVMLPIFAEAHGQKDTNEFRKAVSINFELIWVLALPVTVLIIAFRGPLVSLFGTQYSAALPLIDVLMITAFLNIINSVVGTAMAGSGRLWVGTLFNLLWALILIVMTYLLAPKYGSMGLALAYFTAYLMHSIWQMIYVEKKLAPSLLSARVNLIVLTFFTLGSITIMNRLGVLSDILTEATFTLGSISFPLSFLSTLSQTNMFSYSLNGVIVILSSIPLFGVVRKIFITQKSSIEHSVKVVSSPILP